MGQNLYAFNGNADITKCVTNSRVGWKPPNKQTKITISQNNCIILIDLCNQDKYKRPIGHSAYLTNVRIDKHMIITMFIKRRKNSLSSVWELNGSLFEQTWIPFTQGCTVAGFVEIGTVVIENIFKFVNVFSLFRYYLPLEKGWVLHLNKIESPSPKNALCLVWLKLVQWILRGKFSNFVIFVIS